MKPAIAVILSVACSEPAPLPPRLTDTYFPPPDSDTGSALGCPVEGIGDLNVGMDGFDALETWIESPSVEIFSADGTSYSVTTAGLNHVGIPVGEYTLHASRGVIDPDPGARSGHLWTAERPIRRVCVGVGEDIDVDFVWEEHLFSGSIVAAVANQAVGFNLDQIDAGAANAYALAASGNISGIAVDHFGITWAAVDVGGHPELNDLTGDIERWLASNVGVTTAVDLVVDAENNLLMLADGPDFVGIAKWTPQSRSDGILDDTSPQPDLIPIATIHPKSMILDDDGTPRIAEDSGRVLLVDVNGYIVAQIDPTVGGDPKTGLEAIAPDGNNLWGLWADDTIGSFIAGVGAREVDPLLTADDASVGLGVDATGAVWWIQQGVAEGKVTRYQDGIVSVPFVHETLDLATEMWVW